MKKTIMLVIMLGMIGWAVYEFVFPSDEASTGQAVEEETVESGVNLDNDSADQSENEEQKETTASEPTVGLEVGNLAPDFQLATLSGETVALSDYRGSKVMLNFWATWCPPCRVEMPDMEKFHQDTEIEILAVNLTETEPNTEQVQQFVNEYGLSFPILLDEVIEVANTYAIQPIPTSFMIDSEGIIQFKTFGPLTYNQMVAEMEGMD
ncbi:redoxin domain-containing protein [Gracilibacillus timonensis]|uniref:redoxin domain-containing protein n=1 Tax=Gracilibacillus timonensis TaxID=1816696 RepID=UPI000825433B|nr:redoxin domain-containing protein [Gracilibacillus timonensis]